jgi:hypothetical protein
MSRPRSSAASAACVPGVPVTTGVTGIRPTTSVSMTTSLRRGATARKVIGAVIAGQDESYAGRPAAWLAAARLIYIPGPYGSNRQQHSRLRARWPIYLRPSDEVRFALIASEAHGERATVVAGELNVR